MEKINSKPIVSIIVPSYNHKNFVKECILSIINQSYRNIQLIVVDDGSKDGSREVLKELHNKYKFIYIEQENRGLTKTLNSVIRSHVEGKYLTFCASDDKYTLDRIETQVLFMEANEKYGFAYSKVYKINKESEIIGEVKVPKKHGWLFNELFLGKINFPALSCIYKTDVLLEAGLYDEELIIEDSDMWYKITKNHPVGFIDFYSGYYRRHGSNITTKRQLMYDDTIRRLNKYKSEELYNEAMLNARLQFFFYFSQKNKNEAISLLKHILPKKMFSKFFLAGILNLLGFSIGAEKD